MRCHAISWMSWERSPRHQASKNLGIMPTLFLYESKRFRKLGPRLMMSFQLLLDHSQSTTTSYWPDEDAEGSLSINEHTGPGCSTKQAPGRSPEPRLKVTDSHRFGSCCPSESQSLAKQQEQCEREGQRARFGGSAKAWQSKLMAKVSSSLDFIGIKCLVECRTRRAGCTWNQ